MAEEFHRKYEFIYPPDGSWDHTPVKAESDSPEDQIYAVYANQLRATEGFHAQPPAEPDIPDACCDWIVPDEVDSKWTIEAANVAIKKFNELKGADLRLIDIKDSNSQMVAGFIHFLTLQCSDGHMTHIYEAKIYMPITGDCELDIFRTAKYWPWPSIKEDNSNEEGGTEPEGSQIIGKERKRKDKNKNEEGDAEHEGSQVIGKKRKEQPLLLLRFLSSLASIRKQPFSFDISRFQVEDPSIPPSQSVLGSCFLLALHCAAKWQWNRETVAVSKADTCEEDGPGRREMEMLRNVIAQSLMSART